MIRKARFLRRRSKGENSFILKTPSEVDRLAEANEIVAEAFGKLQDAIQPGISLKELDQMVESFIRSRGALPLYKDYRGNPPTHPPFPGVICASVNEEICHGLPDGRKLKDGDMVGIDIGLRYQEFCGDACVTFAVGQISAEQEAFLKTAKECLYVGIAQARPGNRLGEIGQAIEDHAHSKGYSVVREYGGHGIGRDLHEPISVPHHGPANYGPRLKPGMVFTVEPMINMGTAECELMPDGWTVKTADRKLSAQFEHTIAITREGARILSPWHSKITTTV
ncbi:MAG: type I methionyl aminopeptidase [Anaerolineales bacterium]|nr:type I methionyl aminopeptidase [Anaerolineales bacterium]